jgi:hypothetical protein
VARGDHDRAQRHLWQYVSRHYARNVSAVPWQSPFAAHGDLDAYACAHAYAPANANRDANADTVTDGDVHTTTYGYAYAHVYAYRDGYAYTHVYGDGHGDIYKYEHPCTVPHGDADGTTDCNAKADDYVYISSVGHAASDAVSNIVGNANGL